MRFWGKIKGTEYDYYVAEGKLDGGEEQPEEGAAPVTEASDPQGFGVNEYVYWVTNSPLEEWTKLSNIRPSQII